KIRKSVIYKYCLQYHGSSPENLHIDPDNHPDQLQEKPFHQRIRLRIRNRLQDSADKSDQASNQSRHQGQDQRIFDTVQVAFPVCTPEADHIRAQLSQSIHEDSLLSLLLAEWP